MGDFTADWLDLRAAADRRARSKTLAQRFAAAVSDRNAAPTVVDLAAGSGANALYLAPYLGGSGRWLLVDNDPALLALAQKRSEQAGLRAETRRLDLAAEPGALPLDRAAGLTAAAFMDLVSADWLHDLARRCVALRLPVLFALTYDGRMAFAPADPDDAWVRDEVNGHQRRDKGFGPALGPTAPAEMERILREFGYYIESETTNWELGATDNPLMAALVDGFADAVRSLPDSESDRVESWRRRRQGQIGERTLSLEVGHVDLLALPGKGLA